MKIVEQSYTILTSQHTLMNLPKEIERAARTCYQSEGKTGFETDIKLCRKLIKRGHTAMLEHSLISVRFITDRGVTHELVRHRHTGYAQESTRYVKYDGKMEFIRPVFDWAKDMENVLIEENEVPVSQDTYFTICAWWNCMTEAVEYYGSMIKHGCSPQEARSVLPNSLKTEIVVTTTVREWRSIFELRCSKAAHPQIRALMLPLLKELNWRVPVLFEDIYEKFEEEEEL